MATEFAQLYAYDRWANERILRACEALSPEALTRDLGSSFGSVLATLEHVLAAAWVWVERWEGRSPSGFPGDHPTGLEALRHRWRSVEERQRRFVESLTPDDLERIVDYRNTKGEPFSAPLGLLLRHVINHSTYHRGQVVTLLRQLGAAAPGTDLILYFRELNAGATDRESAPSPLAS